MGGPRVHSRGKLCPRTRALRRRSPTGPAPGIGTSSSILFPWKHLAYINQSGSGDYRAMSSFCPHEIRTSGLDQCHLGTTRGRRARNSNFHGLCNLDQLVNSLPQQNEPIPASAPHYIFMFCGVTGNIPCSDPRRRRRTSRAISRQLNRLVGTWTDRCCSDAIRIWFCLPLAEQL